MADEDFQAILQGMGQLGSAFSNIQAAKARKEEATAQRQFERERQAESERFQSEKQAQSEKAADRRQREERSFREFQSYIEDLQKTDPNRAFELGSAILKAKGDKYAYKNELQAYVDAFGRQAKGKPAENDHVLTQVPVTSPQGEGLARAAVGIGLGAGEALAAPVTWPGMLQNLFSPGDPNDPTRLPSSLGDISSRIGAMSDLLGSGDLKEAFLGGPKFNEAYKQRQEQYRQATEETPLIARGIGMGLGGVAGAKGLGLQEPIEQGVAKAGKLAGQAKQGIKEGLSNIPGLGWLAPQKQPFTALSNAEKTAVQGMYNPVTVPPVELPPVNMTPVNPLGAVNTQQPANIQELLRRMGIVR